MFAYEEKAIITLTMSNAIFNDVVHRFREHPALMERLGPSVTPDVRRVPRPPDSPPNVLRQLQETLLFGRLDWGKRSG